MADGMLVAPRGVSWRRAIMWRWGRRAAFRVFFFLGRGGKSEEQQTGNERFKNKILRATEGVAFSTTWVRVRIEINGGDLGGFGFLGIGKGNDGTCQIERG
jgi:hypothetical protein